jgi:hypothetical protein
LLAFDEFDRQAASTKSRGCGEAGYPTSNDQDGSNFSHVSLRSQRTSRWV